MVTPEATLAAVAPDVTDAPPTPDGSEDVPQPSEEPTATPAVESTSVAGEEVVQSGDGLFQVCRRHCSERWPPDDDALPVYAQQVAEMNALDWPDPALSPDQVLKMPPCPEE
jgi:hypothetical protein